MNTFKLSQHLLLTIIFAGIVMAEVPRTISYQGVLKDDSGVVLNGTHSLTFTLNEDSGTMWAETHLDIEIVDGLFSVILGSIEPLSSDDESLNFDKPYTLFISVDGGAAMGPIELTSSPYSLNSANAEQVKGDNIFPKTGNMRVGNSDVNGTTIDASTGNVGINIEPSSYIELDVNGDFRASSIKTSGYIDYYSDDIFTIRTASNDISLEPNFQNTDPAMVLKADGNVGIGKTPDGYKLDVDGDVNVDGALDIQGMSQSGYGMKVLRDDGWASYQLSGDNDENLWNIGLSGNNNFDFRFNNNPKMTLDNDGDLNVDGDVYAGTFHGDGSGLTGLTPVGTMSMFAGAVAPDGYLLCDGTVLPADAVYDALNDVLNGAYGSFDGRSFVPDMRGRVGVGFNSEITIFDNLGEAGGQYYPSMPSHNHYLDVGYEGGTSGNAAAAYNATGSTSTDHSYSGDTDYGNMPPYTTVNYIIKY